MIGAALGIVLDGIETIVIEVEADVSQGLPSFAIVGLPDSAVSESKQRIRAAIKNAGFPFPRQRITVNLSPASMRKRGAGLDLAIAVAILRAEGLLPADTIEPFVFCAELTLSGHLRPVDGITQLALGLRQARSANLVIASDGCAELLPVSGLSCFHASHLTELVRGLTSGQLAVRPTSSSIWREAEDLPDFSEVQGLPDVKRGLVIAAIGSLHVLLVGPPGSGKSMLAERFRTILPPLTDEAAIQSFALHQTAGQASSPTHLPPLRMPHHSITRAGLLGGGTPLSAGEATLAHHGVLVLDEFLEFSRTVVESLREPLTEKSIRLARMGRHVTLPAAFQLVATLNPCPCGLYGYGDCRCGEQAIRQYWHKVSGPVLDRIDMSLSVPNRRRLQLEQQPTPSAVWRETVTRARTFLREREEWLERRYSTFGDFDPSARELIGKLQEQLLLTGRGLVSVIRMARSIAALEGQTSIQSAHVQEAASYRMQAMV